QPAGARRRRRAAHGPPPAPGRTPGVRVTAELGRPVQQSLRPAEPRLPRAAALLREVPLAPPLRAPARRRRGERGTSAARRRRRPVLSDPRPGEPPARGPGRPGAPAQTRAGRGAEVVPARGRRQPPPLAAAALVLVGGAERLRSAALPQLR